MGFWQITLGDIIGYIFILAGIAVTVKVKFNASSHHNTKDINKVNQSKSTVGKDQVGRDKK